MSSSESERRQRWEDDLRDREVEALEDIAKSLRILAGK
jgi:hypothetical protein